LILNVVVGQNAISGLLNCGAFQNGRPNASYESDNVIVRLFGKGSRDIVKGANFMGVDLVDDLESEIGQIGVNRVGQYIREDNNLRIFLVDFVSNKKIVKIPQTQIVNLVGIHKILRKRLENQTAEKHEPGRRIVMVGLYEIRPVALKRNLDDEACLVSPNVEFDLVSLEFPLNNLRHIDSLTVELDKAVAADRMIIDRQQDISLAQFSCAGSLGRDRADHDSLLVIGQTKRMAFGRIQELEVGDRQIDIAIVAAAHDILQKTSDYRRWDHISDILCDLAAVSLKCDPDNLAILHHRSAG